MEKQEAIAMLKSLIANIENDHVQVVEVNAEEGGSLAALTIVMSGEPEIGRIAD